MFCAMSFLKTKGIMNQDGGSKSVDMWLQICG